MSGLHLLATYCNITGNEVDSDEEDPIALKTGLTSSGVASSAHSFKNRFLEVSFLLGRRIGASSHPRSDSRGRMQVLVGADSPCAQHRERACSGEKNRKDGV